MKCSEVDWNNKPGRGDRKESGSKVQILLHNTYKILFQDSNEGVDRLNPTAWAVVSKPDKVG